MRRPARQRKAIVAIGLLLSALGPAGAGAAETKLVARCGAPEPAAGAAPASVTCDVRATGPAVVKDVTVSLKDGAGDLEQQFRPYDAARQVTTTAYLVQVLPNARRATLAQMGDAVVTFTDQRHGKRRFAAYTFAGDLALIAGSGTSNAEFVRQIIAVKPQSGPVHLYKAAVEAIGKLAKETGDRKALVILGDGTSDDTGDSHDQVVKAAREAGVAIHVLGYYDDRAARSKFQTLERLAEETGGYAAEVKQGPGSARDFSKDIVTGRFVGELLENGGTVKAGLKGAPGARTLVLTATLSDGQRLAAETTVDVPAASVPRFETTLRSEPEPAEEEPSGLLGWLALLAALGCLAGLGVYGYRKYGHLLRRAEPPAAGSDEEPDAATEPVTEPPARPEPVDVAPPASAVPEPAPSAPADRPVVYGWLETLDGHIARHPLRTTNVRVGRHRDNDICLLNDSISRRHAVLHYNADTRRFVITDLGGGNGVVVNRTKYKSRELKDGDTVELGEVRLRFRAEPEYT